jgi:hypothetical protein
LLSRMTSAASNNSTFDSRSGWGRPVKFVPIVS